jgi:hypothetical protein
MSHDADLEAITAHIERHIGRVNTVFHEIVSDDLHIDVHHVKASLFRKFEVLVTSGMSGVAMAVPEDVDQPRFAEVLVILPKGWRLTMEAFKDEKNYWPIAILPPSSLGEKAWCLERKGSRDIFFWAVVPLHFNELKLAMEQGIDPLLELFDRHGVTDRIDPSRKSVV